ncbi:MAG: chloride channel protein [Vicinamibacterales bacterium]
MTRPSSLPTLQGLRLRENQLFFAITVLVGVLAGLSAVLFTLAIEWTGRLFFGLDPQPARLFLVPTVASLLAGVLLTLVFPEVRGSGVPQTKAAFQLQNGVIPIRVPMGKFLMGALCVGSGHSMGREGPSVQIGAGLASAIGQWVGLPRERLRELVPVGAAGALAAAFNTPVSAVIFALEEIIGDLNAPLIGSTVVASVASVMVERTILGNEPLFRVPTYHLVHPAELAAYAVLGVAGGIISLAFCHGLLRARRAAQRLTPRGRMFLPALGGAIIGLVIIVVPQVMGVGYEYIDQALNGGLVLNTLLLLCGVKLVATIVSYATGNAGGIFAPSLYIGAMAGGAVGIVTQWVAPFPTADTGAYALVGMGTLFAGIIRAPLTSVFMIFEITQDYQILVPLMVANMLSFAISRRYLPVPIYHALLEQDGIHLPPAIATPPTDWTAGDAMSDAFLQVPPELTVDEVRARADGRPDRAVFVGAGQRVTGIVGLPEIDSAIAAGRGADAIGAIARPAPDALWVDAPHEEVLKRLLSESRPVPVVDAGDDGVVVVHGAIRATDVLRHLSASRDDH